MIQLRFSDINTQFVAFEGAEKPPGPFSDFAGPPRSIPRTSAKAIKMLRTIFRANLMGLWVTTWNGGETKVDIPAGTLRTRYNCGDYMRLSKPVVFRFICKYYMWMYYNGKAFCVLRDVQTSRRVFFSWITTLYKFSSGSKLECAIVLDLNQRRLLVGRDLI